MNEVDAMKVHVLDVGDLFNDPASIKCDMYISHLVPPKGAD